MKKPKQTDEEIIWPLELCQYDPDYDNDSISLVTTTECLSPREEGVRKAELFKYPELVDPKIRNQVLRMNGILGVATVCCCQGHRDKLNPAHVAFRLSTEMTRGLESYFNSPKAAEKCGIYAPFPMAVQKHWLGIGKDRVFAPVYWMEFSDGDPFNKLGELYNTLWYIRTTL